MTTGNGAFNEFNRIVVGIKPRTNPDYICRIENPADNAKVNAGSDLSLTIKTIKGTTSKVYLYLDETKQDSSVTVPFNFTVNTSKLAAGPHHISIKATDGTSWDDHEIAINLLSNNWQAQNVPFTADSMNVQQIFPVDENVVWAVLNDYSKNGNTKRKFIKTINGGTTWTEGTISCATCNALDISNIYAFSADKAYACLNPGNTTGGAILVTDDGGINWTVQTTANFINSWANWVYFFDASNGVCMGDSYRLASGSYMFSVFTTSNGGTTWTKVSASNIPNALSNEAGTVNFFDAVGSTIWFGTGNGRIFKSSDKGLNWNATDGVLGAVQTDVRFKDVNNGYAFGGYGTGDFGFKKTSDGGQTWQVASISGSISGPDFEYIPGTGSKWINSGLYSSISVMDNVSYYWLDCNNYISTTKFISPTSGWGGGYYSLKLGGGMFKWIGSLTPTQTVAVVLQVKDPNGNPVSGCNAVFNSQVKITNDKGLAIFDIKSFGNPENYSVSKSGYATLAANYNVQGQDTVKIILTPSCTTTFKVSNNSNVPIAGAIVIFNGISQTTDATGSITFSEVARGQYPYAITKSRYFAGYGIADLKDAGNIINITLLSDGTYTSSKKQKIQHFVFPNPASEVLNIVSEQIITGVKVISMNGKVVLNKAFDSNTIQVPLYNVKNGEYILKVSQGKNEETYKLVVKH